MQGKYISTLTAMRGVAALWVILFHIDVSLYFRDMGSLISREASGLLSRGYLWVDFFFILSGFIIAHVYAEALAGGPKVRGALAYLWARFARIYPLHLFCLALVVLIAVTYPLFVPNVKDGSWETFMAWKAIPSNLLLTHAMNQHVYLSWDIVSWSIGAEWWTYVVTLPVLILLLRMPGWVVSLMSAIAFAGLCVLVATLPDKNLDITFNYGFLRCLCEFVVGLGVWRLWRAGRMKWAGYDATTVFCLVAVSVAFQFKCFGEYGDLLLVPIFALLTLGLAYNDGGMKSILDSRPLQYLGRISYSLYLVHGVVFSAFWFLMPWAKAEFGAPSDAMRWAYAVAYLVVVIAISQLTYSLVERPARKQLQYLWRETSIEQVGKKSGLPRFPQVR